MLQRKSIIILLFCLYSTNAYSADKAGFDEICKIYTESVNSSMTKEQLSDYIFDNIKNRVNLADALDAHNAIFNLEPAKRYSIFKQSAEFSLKHSWDCEAMKSLLK